MDHQAIREQFLKDFRKVFPHRNVDLLTNELLKCETVFKKYDQDGSGDIDLSEAADALASLGNTKSKQELKELVQRVDDDNSGTLRFREFINLMLIESGFLDGPLDGGEKPVKANVGASVGKRTAGRGALKKKKRGFLYIDLKATKNQKNVTVTVTIKEAKDLLPMDFNGLSDPYCKVKINHQKDPEFGKKTKKKTKVMKRNLNPQWNETFEWNLPANINVQDFKVNVSIYDWDLLKSNDFMGGMTFDLEEVLSGEAQSGWYIVLDEVQSEKSAFPSRVTNDGVPADITRSIKYVNKKPGKARSDSVPNLAANIKLTVEDFNFTKLLGKGNFSKVFLAQCKTNNQYYAVKAINKSDDPETFPAIMAERRALAVSGNPPFLPALIAAFQSPSTFFLVMEFVTGGDFMFHMTNLGSFSETAVVFYAAEISSALHFLHGKAIIYRDLKLDNIMVDSKGHIKLTDFGFSKYNMNSDQKTTTFCGTPNYLAPEIVKYLPYSFEVDWWALGVVIFEMLTGASLFEGDEEDILFRSILKQELALPQELSDESRAIICGFVTRNPQQRLGSGPRGKDDIRSHPFFRSINWADLDLRKVRPPFVPKLKHALDTAYFDMEFISDDPVLSPVDAGVVARANEFKDDFAGFTFVNERFLAQPL